MNALFQYIKTRLNTQVPAIKSVLMFNDQLVKENTDRTQKPVPYPACFVEFITTQIDNRSFGIKDYVMLVRFRFMKISLKFERPETFDFMDQFDVAMRMMAPTVASGLTFTTFQEEFLSFDTDHNNVESPYRDYRTRFRWFPPGAPGVIVNGVNLQVVKVIGNSIDFSQAYNSGNVAIISFF
jgi:hypothetical protein